MTAAEGGKNAKVFRLAFDIPGVAQAGDAIIHTPDHPKPHLRLIRVRPMNIEHLPEIKEKVGAYNTALSGLIKSSGGRMPGEVA